MAHMTSRYNLRGKRAEGRLAQNSLSNCTAHSNSAVEHRLESVGLPSLLAPQQGPVRAQQELQVLLLRVLVRELLLQVLQPAQAPGLVQAAQQELQVNH